MAQGKFTFTITDLGLFLGKSPVTLRGWERDGLITLPRDSGGDRKLSTEDVRVVTRVAHVLGRISTKRRRLIDATMTLLEYLESK